MLLQRNLSTDRSLKDNSDAAGETKRRRGMINFLTWAFFLSAAYGQSEALATGLNSSEDDARSDDAGSDASSPLSLGRPDAALSLGSAETLSAGPQTALHHQYRADQYTVAGREGGDGPDGASAGQADNQIDSASGSGGGGDGTVVASGDDVAAAAHETPVDVELPADADIGIDLGLPDSLDSILSQTVGAVDSILGTLDNTLDGLTSTLSPVVSILDDGLGSGLTNTLDTLGDLGGQTTHQVLDGITSTTSPVTSALADISSGTLSFASTPLQQLGSNELVSNGRLTDFGITLQLGSDSESADPTTSQLSDGDALIGNLDSLHLGDDGDGIDTHSSQDGLVRIGSDLLT